MKTMGKMDPHAVAKAGDDIMDWAIREKVPTFVLVAACQSIVEYYEKEGLTIMITPKGSPPPYPVAEATGDVCT